MHATATRQGNGVAARRGTISACRERGAATLSLILTLCILVVAFAVFYTTRIGKFGAQESTLQTAADAAALAGAQEIVSQAPGQVVSSIRTGSGFAGTLGQSAASEFAQRNGATLIRYRYLAASDRIEVTVRSQNALVSGARESATASAQVGLRLQACVVGPAPSPSPSTPASPSTPGGSPSPRPTTPPPTSYDTMADCGDLRVPVTMPTGAGAPVLKITAAELKGRFTPALTA